MKKIFVALSMGALLHATTIGELFLHLKNHSQTKVDMQSIKQADIAQKMILSKLYPKVDIFASYDNYSDPTNLLPVTPKESATFKDPSIAQPFSDEIYRYGAKLSMPIFVKSLYTLAKKAKVLKSAAISKKRIDLLKNEALIVGSDANLIYLEQLQKALDMKKRSLLVSKNHIKLKVDVGRAPKIALYKIDDAINKINITQNQINMQKENIKSVIKALTGVTLKRSVPIKKYKKLKKKNLGVLKPLKEKIKASKLDLKSKKESFYPSIALHGSYVHSDADAYNNGKDVSRDYSDIGVGVNMPLLNVSLMMDIQRSKVNLKKTKLEFEKQKDELKAKADLLTKTLSLLKESLKYAKKNIDNKKRLLTVAKVDFDNQNITTEEYLRYEDDLVSAKANYYKIKADIWQTLMELAVLYTNDIEEMVK